MIVHLPLEVICNGLIAFAHHQSLCQVLPGRGFLAMAPPPSRCRRPALLLRFRDISTAIS